jgi:malate dehydrogenase (oxaloacetate-decarboxylating)
MTNNLTHTSWQERYHASGIYTLRCKLLDRATTLGEVISAIGKAGIHVGNITVVDAEPDYKVQDITIYCDGAEAIAGLTAALKGMDTVEVLSVQDNILETHRKGTIKMVSRTPINTVNDLRMVYTPGVASVCKEIEADPSKAAELTGLCDRVGIVTNGTAVLGLGDIGVVPSLPVMEGKASIFAEFADLSAIPVLIDSKEVDVVVETVMRIAKGFGAIQLEDIAAPACFAIEKQLQDLLDIPVLHDDQHGTATVTLAALITSLKLTNRKPEECSALILGAGAAGQAIAYILLKFGLKDVVIYDSTGPIYRGRTASMNPYKEQLAQVTNKNNQQCPLAEGFKGKDIFIGVARPKMVTKEMIASMNPNPIVFPMSNPVGEITVEEAREAGAAIAADGRSINNALVYPGLFRGALDAGATDITYEMQVAAAETAASLAEGKNLLPDMLDRDVHRQIIQAVADAWRKSR